MPIIMVEIYRHFRVTYFLHIQDHPVDEVNKLKKKVCQFQPGYTALHPGMLGRHQSLQNFLSHIVFNFSALILGQQVPSNRQCPLA